MILSIFWNFTWLNYVDWFGGTLVWEGALWQFHFILGRIVNTRGWTWQGIALND